MSRQPEILELADELQSSSSQSVKYKAALKLQQLYRQHQYFNSIVAELYQIADVLKDELDKSKKNKFRFSASFNNGDGRRGVHFARSILD